ncbi:MAG: hypothetical protein ACRETI_06060 [Steroidobacteraceae bacterium]
MAKSIFFGIMVVAFLVAFFASVTGVVSIGRLLMHLRKLDPSAYQQIGGEFLALFGGKPAFHEYLRNRSYRESAHDSIRTWGKRYHLSVATMFAAVAIGLISAALGHLTMR